jgi:hypothetical protein
MFEDYAVFSVTKVSEGGMGQRWAMQLLKDAGIKAEKAYSPYVGQTAVQVKTRNKRLRRRIERILYGS